MNRVIRHSTAVCLLAFAAMLISAGPCLAAATLTQKIEPQEVNVGDPIMVTLTVQNGTVSTVQLPPVDGLELDGTNEQIQSMDVNGVLSSSMSFIFSLAATRPGNFTIPAFDFRTQEGDLIHVRPMKIHALGAGSTPSNSTATNSQSPLSNTMTITITPNGPVVMPQNPAQAQNPAPNNSAPQVDVPVKREADGSLPKVFLVITADTTNAYVGQAVPLRIDFYIRMDVNAPQNSLPTINGSDFLMNAFTTRGQASLWQAEDQQYEKETWLTAIAAPKAGDFPLTMTRDSYWVKGMSQNNLDPFSFFFNRQAALAHENISSNTLTMHVQALPDSGQPDHFTGAIGQFNVSASADPQTVAVGEPVTIHYVVSGAGNFDYVHAPVLASDPAWKAYTPTPKVNYLDVAHINANKTFDQSVIPQKNGLLPLPPASFSYFDPTTKQYVTVPVSLPTITVTGSPLPAIAAAPDGDDSSSASPAPAQAAGMLANRTELGSIHAGMTPAYRQAWFWIVQGGVLMLPFVGIILFTLARRAAPEDVRAERMRRRHSLEQEEAAMAEAVQKNDPLTFFVAARHAVQLQLGARWKIQPEALTLAEIRQRDAALAETLEPLFTQADQVMYSGLASGELDLARWERAVRTEILELQTA